MRVCVCTLASELPSRCTPIGAAASSYRTKSIQLILCLHANVNRLVSEDTNRHTDIITCCLSARVGQSAPRERIFDSCVSIGNFSNALCVSLHYNLHSRPIEWPESLTFKAKNICFCNAFEELSCIQFCLYENVNKIGLFYFFKFLSLFRGLLTYNL